MRSRCDRLFAADQSSVAHDAIFCDPLKRNLTSNVHKPSSLGEEQ
jgi:hypothetical protein